MAYGYRALMRTLSTYINKHKANTIERIIYRWAPGFENDTESYIRSVCKSTGFSRSKKLVADKKTLTALAAAISLHENGVPAVMADIEEGWKLL